MPQPHSPPFLDHSRVNLDLNQFLIISTPPPPPPIRGTHSFPFLLGAPEFVAWTSGGHVPAEGAPWWTHHHFVARNRPPATWHPREGKSEESTRAAGTTHPHSTQDDDEEHHYTAFRKWDGGPPQTACTHSLVARVAIPHWDSGCGGPRRPIRWDLGFYPFGVGMFGGIIRIRAQRQLCMGIAGGGRAISRVKVETLYFSMSTYTWNVRT